MNDLNARGEYIIIRDITVSPQRRPARDMDSGVYPVQADPQPPTASDIAEGLVISVGDKVVGVTQGAKVLYRKSCSEAYNGFLFIKAADILANN